MRPWLKDPQKLSRVMDPALEGKYSFAAVQKAAMVAYRCLSGSPKNRPDMSAVVEDLEPLLTVVDEDVPPAGEAAAPARENEDVKKERTARRRDGDQRDSNKGNGHGRRNRARSPKRTNVRRRAPGQSEEFWEWHMPAEGKA
ncbi:hypothetical protein EJB05_06152, partial [Eragrostis curvula]